MQQAERYSSVSKAGADLQAQLTGGDFPGGVTCCPPVYLFSRTCCRIFSSFSFSCLSRASSAASRSSCCSCRSLCCCLSSPWPGQSSRHSSPLEGGALRGLAAEGLRPAPGRAAAATSGDARRGPAASPSARPRPAAAPAPPQPTAGPPAAARRAPPPPPRPAGDKRQAVAPGRPHTARRGPPAARYPRSPSLPPGPPAPPWQPAAPASPSGAASGKWWPGGASRRAPGAIPPRSVT